MRYFAFHGTQTLFDTRSNTKKYNKHNSQNTKLGLPKEVFAAAPGQSAAPRVKCAGRGAEAGWQAL